MTTHPMDPEDWTVATVGDGSVTLVAGRDFVISASSGDMARGAVHGLIHEDRRFLDVWALRITGHELRPLTYAVPTPFQGVFVGRVHDTDGRPLPILIVRRRSIGRGMREVIEVHNSSREPIGIELTLEAGADFGHLFEVKAGATASPPTRCAPVDGDPSTLAISPHDDDVVTLISTEPRLTRRDDHGGAWRLAIAPHDVGRVAVTVEPSIGGRPAGGTVPEGFETFDEASHHRHELWREQTPSVSSRDPRLAITVRRALDDLASLRIHDTAHPELAVVAAGAPWFMTLFGRDALITAYMALPFAPELARGVLHELAILQGSTIDPVSAEEPGKILHELRSPGGSGPFSSRTRYYGTVDATPLYVLLATEAVRWGAVSVADRQWLVPAVDAAMRWIVEHGDSDADGFVDYRPHVDGLSNQGWKDSWDGVNSADGSLPDPPIALAEVQGYVYAAFLGAAELYRMLDREDDAVHFDREAKLLRQAFNRAFWDDRGWFVQAVGRDGRPVDSLGSNPGHALWTGIAEHDRADRYLDAVMEPEMWSGWGVRTLATSMAAYDPLSYHNGSVWPHDTAILIAGAARYGRWDVVDVLSDGLLDASTYFGGRLPELFSGVGRDVVPVPVAYPGSCSPQAWAAASVLLVLRANLGLDVDAWRRTVRFDPRGALVAGDVRCERLAVAGRHLDVDLHDGELTARIDGFTVIDARRERRPR